MKSTFFLYVGVKGEKTMPQDIISVDDIRSKIHTIRGVQVMLDYDLAKIYGYSTKTFNQQIKNNIERFPEDFRFQLTNKEIDELSWSNNLTSIMQVPGKKGGRVYLPYAFTEQCIYMLMTVLRGELAVKSEFSFTLKEVINSQRRWAIAQCHLLN